jgi:hypothetical protein
VSARVLDPGHSSERTMQRFESYDKAQGAISVCDKVTARGEEPTDFTLHLTFPRFLCSSRFD